MNTSTRGWLVAGLLVALAGCASSPSPPVAGAPRYPTYAFPDIPQSLAVSADVSERHRIAWARLQDGDLRGATRDFSGILRATPGFYPAEAGMGYVKLADKEYREAAVYFQGVTAKSPSYLPAWIGLSEAEIADGRDVEAIAAMEKVLALDPRRGDVKSRLELVRFREVQRLIEAGQRHRAARRYPEAKASFEQALAVSPSSTASLRELILVATAAESVLDAEGYARRVVQLEPNEAIAHAELGEILERQSKLREAAAAFARAASLDARPDWRERAASLREKADLAAVPREFGDLSNAAAVTRAQVAAFVGLRLGTALDAAPRRQAAIATDLRSHWASPWIAKVTQAGVMDVFPNHTFQPSGTVRRGDLAQIVAAMLGFPAVSRLPEASRWRAARPRFSDLPTNNVFYRPAALAVAAGTMTADGGAFNATRPASGADLSAAVTRLEQLLEP
jgi:tetratricopeptide (TPR) repeat protein